jgi:calcium-dependent protein kinase
VREKRGFTEEEARDAIRQMLLALNYMHSHGVVHRDVKLENFVYDKKDGNHLKLIDFGFSTRWASNSKRTMTRYCGTLSYTAPEVFAEDYTSQCDLWSLGVIGFGLLSGGMPFSGTSAEQRGKIKAGDYTMKPERWDCISSEAKDFIQSLLKMDPASRLSAQQALEHPWIASVPTLLQSGLAQAAQSLHKFSRVSKFRQNCMRVLAWTLPQEDMANSYQLFLSLDKSQTGSITFSELRNVMAEELQMTNDSEIMQTFAALDYNHDQEIHFSDFLAAMIGTVIDFRDSSLRTAFRVFDRDGTGCVTADDLRDVLSVADGKPAHAYIQLADPQNKGHICFADFSDYVKHMSQEGTSETTSFVCICKPLGSDAVCICKAPESAEYICPADVASNAQNEVHSSSSYDNFNAAYELEYETLKNDIPIHGNKENKRESIAAFVQLIAVM